VGEASPPPPKTNRLLHHEAIYLDDIPRVAAQTRSIYLLQILLSRIRLAGVMLMLAWLAVYRTFPPLASPVECFR